MSLRASISPSRRAGLRFVAQARRFLLQALAEEGVTQSAAANEIGVHRSVISRELKGLSDIGLVRVGEIAYATGRTPELRWRGDYGATGHNSTVKSIKIENGASVASMQDVNALMRQTKSSPALEDA